jgi:hypothetical protein
MISDPGMEILSIPGMPNFDLEPHSALVRQLPRSIDLSCRRHQRSRKSDFRVHFLASPLFRDLLTSLMAHARTNSPYPYSDVNPIGLQPWPSPRKA